MMRNQDSKSESLVVLLKKLEKLVAGYRKLRKLQTLPKMVIAPRKLYLG
jgi:hypothetical protein